jgi:predicted amidohydrolase
MVTRCLENRVFAVTTNRTGTDRQGEREFSFTGRSQITGCRGEILARADGFSDSLTFVSIDPASARDKAVTPYNQVDSDRRPEFYD